MNDPALSTPSIPSGVAVSSPIGPSTPTYQLTYESPSFNLNSVDLRIRVWTAVDPQNEIARFYRIQVLNPKGDVSDEKVLHFYWQYLSDVWAIEDGDRIRVYLRCQHGRFRHPTYLFEVDDALTLKEDGVFIDKADVEAEEALRQELRKKEEQERKKLTMELLEKDCTAKGGRWETSCLGPLFMSCVTPFPDGGKDCSDGSECASHICEYDLKNDGTLMPQEGIQAKGVCRRDDHPCGCTVEIVGGRTRAGICAD